MEVTEMEASTQVEQGAIVTRIYFAVPTHYTIGREFDTWAEAVEQARSTIQRFEYRGQDPDHAYSRAFVDLRQIEPTQPRGDGVPSGSDGPVMRWEVFHDGTVRAMNRGES